ncbi:hypothetical protein IP023_13025 [Sphingobacterium rhinopitheci]|nr:hypothetical protein [Sphingobacterium rhinopitheci]
MKYTLESGSKKFHCPNCDKKTYVRYIDTSTNQYIDYEFGRCDRESRCQYHNKPNFGIGLKMRQYTQRPIQKKEVVYFNFEVFKVTLQSERYVSNVFIQNLSKNVLYPFKISDLNTVISIYRLGTVVNGYRAGGTTFPFIDINQNVRAIQVKQFDENNHTIGTDFLHSIIEKHYKGNNKDLPKWLKEYINQDKRISCLFGEHLLSKYPNNPIALVEAPKTAIYGTLYFGFPEESESNMIWLAVYNKSSFSFDKLKVLKGRDVFVFPDLSNNKQTYNEWQQKALNYESQLSNTRFIFSDILERYANNEQKERGLDLADFLIIQDWSRYRLCEKCEKSEA